MTILIRNMYNELANAT